MRAVDTDRLATELVAQSGALAQAVAGLEPDAVVTTCPQWSVRDLVSHVGSGHRWATRIVTDPRGSVVPNLALAPPPDPARWADWLTDGARELIAQVRHAGPGRKVWTWRPPHVASFWVCKLAHDTLIHRVDAELSAGLPCSIAPDLAADGVTDLLESIAALSRADHPDPVFRTLAGNGQRLQLVATDVDPTVGCWHVERHPDGVQWHHGTAEADVHIAGSVTDLLLVLNRRMELTSTGLQVRGDATHLDDWLSHSAF